MSSSHYESAAKGLEQEKRMVAALKRLSIGNRMNYDPDLPPEEGEFVAQTDWMSDRSPSPSESPRTSPPKSPSDENESGEEMDPEKLLWVPAKMHPEVDPELFKMHVKNAVEEIMERKLSRKLSRRLSLLGSASETPDPATPEHRQQSPVSPGDPRKRFSNPSLHQLSSELESLSRKAGMDANDAVTLARTLSSSSLGYTNSERIAIDELTLPPRSRTPSHRDSETAPPEEFQLKRSRRLDYRKNLAASGSSLQSNKAGKLAELRSNLNSSESTTVPALHSAFNVPKARSKHRKARNNRDSQSLFLYRNPNEKPDKGAIGPSLRSARDSPYSTASSSASIEKHFTPTYHPQYRRLILGSLLSSSHSLHGPVHPNLQKTPHTSQIIPQTSSQNLQSPPQNPPPQQYHQSSHKGRRGDYRPRQAPPPQPRGHPLSLVSPVQLGPASGQNKPPQVTVTAAGSPVKEGLNKNLDLLRSEINEFKESLSTRRVPGTTESSDSSDNNESDFSFETSYQDVSYEDSLGMEQDILPELEREPKDRHLSFLVEVPVAEVRGKSEVASRQRKEVHEVGKRAPGAQRTREKAAEKIREEARDQALLAGSERRGSQRDGELLVLSKPSEKVLRERKENYREFQETKEPDYADESRPVHPQPLQSQQEQKYQPSEGQTQLPQPPQQQPEPDSRHKESSSVEELAKISGAAPKMRTLKKKKSWPWMRERLVSLDGNNELGERQTSSKLPSRSVSTPEIAGKPRERTSSEKENKVQPENRNMISKLFRKKKPVKQTYTTSGVTVDYESDLDSDEKKSKKKRSAKKKIYSNLLQLTSSTLLSDEESKESTLERRASLKKNEPVVQEPKRQPERSEGPDKKSQLAESKSAPESDPEEYPLEALTPTKKPGDEIVSKTQATLDVQEKLKKSIKRTSRANQPIEFTDSAFGFPLPPPSQSTLIMLDYRFPVHVERAIYRLSHLKLANPKRSLSEQVLLSNFMYAYLNLVDHTLHLEMAEELQGEIEVAEPDKMENDDADNDTVMVDLDVAG